MADSLKLRDCQVLVTGADGFIGSHLTEVLVARGCKVRAFVYYNSLNSWGWLEHSKPEVKAQIQVVAGDVRDPHSVKAAMQGCQVVFHLAALIAIPYSYIAPQSYIETNIGGTLNVLQAARELGTLRVVCTSTSEVYGTARQVPMSESHPLSGQSPYAATKIGADQLALSFHCSFGTPVSVIRPFNTFGPRQSARAIIPTVITQIATGHRRLRLGSLSPSRDFSFVLDTVQGFIGVAESAKAIGEVVNVGSGYEITIHDLAVLIAELMGSRIDLETDTGRVRPEKSEVLRLCADTRKAQALIGWNPRYAGRTGFERALQETIAWFTTKDVLNCYKAEQYNT